MISPWWNVRLTAHERDAIGLAWRGDLVPTLKGDSAVLAADLGVGVDTTDAPSLAAIGGVILDKSGGEADAIVAEITETDIPAIRLHTMEDRAVPVTMEAAATAVAAERAALGAQQSAHEPIETE